MNRGLAAAARALGLAVAQKLVSPRWFDTWAAPRPEIAAAIGPGLEHAEIAARLERLAPATPLALRGYLGLLHDRYVRREVPALDFYAPECFSDAERARVDGFIEARAIDAYRLALDAVERLGPLECREVKYLETLAGAWRYEDDPGLVDGPRMCSVLSLMSEFLHLYRELAIDDPDDWERADRACQARNTYLDELDGGAATAAALEATRAEERAPERFRR